MDFTLTIDETVIENPYVAELGEAAIAKGFGNSDDGADINAYLKAAKKVSLIGVFKDETYNLTEKFLEEPEPFIEAINDIDLGKLAFIFSEYGGHYFDASDLVRKCDEVSSGTYDAESMMQQFHPELYDMLDDMSALHCFDSEKYMQDLFVVKPGWFDGNDYWMISPN